MFTLLKVWKTAIMAIFAILSKDTEELIFDQLCYNGEKYGKLLFWSYLPSWAKLRIKWYLAKFATLSKTVANDYFDHICHTVQRYGRSNNLTSFTTLSEPQIRWMFAQIYYPGQNCWKMSFGHFCYIVQKWGGNYYFDRNCYREQKRSKIHLRSLLQIWGKCGIYHLCH